MRDASATLSPSSIAPATAPPPPMAARTKLLLEGPILPTLLRLAAPNILNLAAFAGVITFDGFFLGHLGTDTLAGASLAFPWVMLLLQTTNSGVGNGVSSAVARALGAGDRDRAEALAVHALLLALVLGATFAAAMLLGGPFVFGWMGGHDDMLSAALSVPASASACSTCSATWCAGPAI
jgi:MATE family, multidrug efflux pump